MSTIITSPESSLLLSWAGRATIPSVIGCSSARFLSLTSMQSQLFLSALEELPSLAPRATRKSEARRIARARARLLERLRAHHEPTFEHCIRVGLLSAALANQLGYDRAFVARTRLVGELHDVGKVMVPVELLDAPRSLRPKEWEVMRAHARHTRTILRQMPSLAQFADDAAFHHERIDGSGYPYGIAGENISAATRIVTVADMYDAMTNRRAYHLVDPMPIVLETIAEGIGKWWDRSVVAALVQIVRLGYSSQRSHETEEISIVGHSDS